MNGLATQTAVSLLRTQGRNFLADEVAHEFKQVCAERDHARDLAASYEAEIHRAKHMALDLHRHIVAS